MQSTNRQYATWLWILLTLFCFRVAGQMMVVFLHASYLPPLEEWQSGLLPYPLLLASQFVIIVIMFRVARDFTAGEGYFVVPNRRLANGLINFGWIYVMAMVARYIIRMTLYPDQRWFGGTIPIVFHWVLGSFLLLVGSYHRNQSRNPTTEAEVR
jgi:uncharacterized protein